MKNSVGLVTSLQSGLRRALEELGGTGGDLEAVLHRRMRGFYDLMAQDLMIGFFFTDKNLDHVALQQTRFLLRAAGIKNEYTGKAPARAHEDLPPILRGHFHRRLVLLREFLTAQGLSAVSVDAWVAFEAAFEDMIVKS